MLVFSLKHSSTPSSFLCICPQRIQKAYSSHPITGLFCYKKPLLSTLLHLFSILSHARCECNKNLKYFSLFYPQNTKKTERLSVKNNRSVYSVCFLNLFHEIFVYRKHNFRFIVHDNLTIVHPDKLVAQILKGGKTVGYNNDGPVPS